MTKGEIEVMLVKHGMQPGSKSWTDYESAKRLIQDLVTSPGEYDRAIAVIGEYLEI